MVYKIPFQVIFPEKDGCHLLIKVMVNGIVANFIIDTGASNTVMDLNSIETFVVSPEFTANEAMSTGLGSNTIASHILYVDHLSIGNFSLEKYRVVLLDLSHINEVFSQLDLGTVHGILGGDLFLKYHAKIDYKYKTLIFRTRN